MSRPRLYEQVIERLREYVAEERLRAGDKLPAERELAQRLGVSRASVKQAIVVLEVQGLVETRHGGGSYLVRDTLDAEPVDQLVARRRRLPDVLEAREAIEEGGYVIDGDRRLHAAVTAAARGATLAGFMRCIAEQVSESRTESLRQPGRRSRSLRPHQAIFDAISRGDPARGATAMRRHVRTVAKVRLLDWNPDSAD